MAFLGISEFKHFVGVVEDRFDPEKLGRLRVRCLGIHTSDKNKIATADLPWASVMLPTTSSGISGLGQSPSFIVEGAWVWGYFRDGDGLMQEMVIVGTLPGRPAELGKTASGFYDPNSRVDADRQPTGVSVYPKQASEPDTNRLAVNDPEKPHSTLTARRAARLENIPTADFDEISPNITASDTDNWSQPEIPYSATYPYNHVFESESGHIKEYDDTFRTDPDTGERAYFTRIHERHRSGTSYEIDNAGNKIDLNVASYFNITEKDNKHFIKGDSDITIDGRHKVYINKSGTADNNYDIQVGPNANVNIQVDNGNLNVVTKEGKFNFDVGSDMNINVGGNYNLNVQGSETKTVEGSTTHNTTGSTTIRGRTIDLNP